MRIQGLNITYSKLKELLELPDEAQVVGIEKREDHPRSFAVHIEHPEFDEDEYEEELSVGVWYSLEDFLDQFKKKGCCR